MHATEKKEMGNGVFLHYLISGDKHLAVATGLDVEITEPAKGPYVSGFDENRFIERARKRIAERVLKGE